MIVRKLTEDGLRDFDQFIVHLRNGNEQNNPAYLLTDPLYSEPIGFEIDVDSDRVFDSRYDMGRHLVERTRDVNLQQLMGDRGFWSWFALLWFDQLCPTKQRQRKPSQVYNYILSKSYNHRPRHSIYMTWQLVNRYGDAARFMLCKPMDTRGEITEQLMARQEILSSEGAMKLASSLYFDPHAGTFKRGAAARKSAGCVTRYIAWLQQLQLTFDLYSISADDLAAMLPREFERFRSDSVPAS